MEVVTGYIIEIGWIGGMEEIEEIEEIGEIGINKHLRLTTKN